MSFGQLVGPPFFGYAFNLSLTLLQRSSIHDFGNLLNLRVSNTSGEMDHPWIMRIRPATNGLVPPGLPEKASPKKKIPEKGSNSTMNFRGVQLGSKIWGMAVLPDGN